MDVAAAVGRYLEWCRRHRAPGTVGQWASRLRTFVARFAARELASLTPLEVDEWLGEAGRRGDGTPKAPDTVRNYAVAYEAFQSWAVRFELLPKPVIANLEKPRGRLRKRIPTAEETAAVLAHATPEFALVYRALRQCGARPGELAAASIADIDREPGLLVLDNHKTARKTGDPRRIAIGTKLRAILDEATAGRTDPAAPVFLTPRRTRWTSQNLSRTFARLRGRAGLAGDLVLYLTRHEHATLLCRKRDIHAASQALGHKRLTTTQRYIKTSTDELRADQDLVE